MIRKTSLKFASALCLGLTLLTGGTASAQTALSPELQKVYAEAVKVIPGLSPDLIAQAAKEGELTMYRVGYDFRSEMFPEFTKLFPFLTISDFEATVGALMQRYTAEASSGRNVADVIMSSLPVAVEGMDRDGLVQHYTPTSAASFGPGKLEGVYYPLSRVSLCNAYNANTVSAADAALLTTWEGVKNPRWKGKSGIVRFGTGGVAILPYYFLDKQGVPFADILGAQQPLVFNSIPAMIERLAAGGLDTVFFANDGNLTQMYKTGAPVRWVCPEPGLSVYNFQFIAAKAPHSAAAKLWLEFAMSKRGQELVMKSLGLGPARQDVKDERAVTAEPWFKGAKTAFDYSWADIGKQQADLQAKWTAAASGIKAGD